MTRALAVLLPNAPESRRRFWEDAFQGRMIPVRDAEPTGIILPDGRKIAGWMVDFNLIGEPATDRILQVLAKRKHPPLMLATFKKVGGYPIEGNEHVVVISTESGAMWEALLGIPPF